MMHSIRAQQTSLVLLVALVVAGCGSGSSAKGAPKCVGGDERACTCPDGEGSIAYCQYDDPTHFACQCPPVRPPPVDPNPPTIPKEACVDMAVDANHGILYLSNGNSSTDHVAEDSNLAAYDVRSATLLWSIPLTEQADSIDISDDGSTVFATSTGAHRVVRVDTASQTVVRIEPGPDASGHVFWPITVRAVPGHPHSFLAATTGGSIWEWEFWDEGTRRPNGIGNASDRVVLQSDTVLSVLEARLLILASVDDSGLHETGGGKVTFPQSLNPRRDIRYAGGKIFTGEGFILDAKNAHVVGQVPASGSVAVELEKNRIYFSGMTMGSTEHVLVAYDATTLAEVGRQSTNGSADDRNLSRWGTNGFAFLVPRRGVMTFTSDLVPP